MDVAHAKIAGGENAGVLRLSGRYGASRPGSRSNDSVATYACCATRKDSSSRSRGGGRTGGGRAVRPAAPVTKVSHRDIRRKHSLLTCLLPPLGFARKTRRGRAVSPETSLFLTSPASLLIKTHWPTLTVMLARKCSFPGATAYARYTNTRTPPPPPPPRYL